MSLSRLTLTILFLAVSASTTQAQTASNPLAQFKKLRAEAIAVIETANDLGIAGRWIVLESKKDGVFSNAQIGQEPGDVITIGDGQIPGQSTWVQLT